MLDIEAVQKGPKAFKVTEGLVGQAQVLARKLFLEKSPKRVVCMVDAEVHFQARTCNESFGGPRYRIQFQAVDKSAIHPHTMHKGVNPKITISKLFCKVEHC